MATIAHPEPNRNELVREFLGSVLTSDSPQPEAWSESLLRDAVRARATDIHVDPVSDGVRIRLRVDGEVLTAAHVPREVGQQLINQMKVLARLDPMLSALPLESRWQQVVDRRQIDIRLTAIAYHIGEKLHARLLDHDRLDVTFESLGLDGENHRIIESWQSSPDGMLLVTCPTGSGKTTMLHAVLRQFVETPSVVLTIEDPVEYRNRIRQRCFRPSRQ